MIDFNIIIKEVNQRTGLSFEPAPHAEDKEGSYTALYSGEFFAHGIILIGFKESFPYSLPVILVKNISAPRLHVERNGKICLTDESSLLKNVDRHIDLILECLDRADKILSLTADSPEYQQELRKEFLFYWGMRDEKRSATYWSILPLSDLSPIQEVSLFPVGNRFILAPTLADANCFICDYYGLAPIEKSKKPFEKALVIRIKEGGELPSPFCRYDWSKVVRYIIKNTNVEDRQLFWEKTSLSVKQYILRIVFVLPDPSGDILFGMLIHFRNKKKMPIKASKSNMVWQIQMIRYDYDYLLSRCGAMPSLKEKQVLLLGCGSVGGFLANNLCQMGVTQLDLLDKDSFASENVHRHFMGFEAIKLKESSKADLLRNVLNDKYSYLDIDSLNYVDRTVEKIILDNPNRLAQYDLVISALGEPTLNLAINDLLIEHNIKTPFIVCFNEPYGVGGHVVTTNLSEESCLRCFYSEQNYGTLCSFRGSLVEPSQNFKKSLSGCSGTFVPYSALDSQQTAIHAARKAVDVLTGNLANNDFYTWRGDASTFVAQGYSVSGYFYADAAPKYFSNPNCPTCQRRNLTS